MNISRRLVFFEAQLIFYTAIENIANCVDAMEETFVLRGVELALPTLTSHAHVIIGELSSSCLEGELIASWRTLCLVLNQDRIRILRDSSALIKAAYLLSAITWVETANCSEADGLRKQRCVTMHPPSSIIAWNKWYDLRDVPCSNVLRFITTKLHQ